MTHLRNLQRTTAAGTAVVCAATLLWGVAAATGASGTLTAKQYAALDSVYQPLEMLDPKTKDPAAALASVRRVCAKLNRSDRLLATSRRQCLSFVKLVLTDDPTCASKETCQREFRAVRRLTQVVLSDSRAQNRAISRAVGGGRCGRFLRTSAKALRGFENLIDGYRRVESALWGGDTARLRRAIKHVNALPEPSSGGNADKKFRAECRRG